MADKKELTPGRKRALRAYEEDILECNREIERLTLRRLEFLQEVRKIQGERGPSKSTRPWELIKERVIEEGRPLTLVEAYLSVCVLDQFAMKIVWEGDLRRSIGGSDDLKIVNDLVGLSEWPDKMFRP